MSLGDEEHRISILFDAVEEGEHVHVTVRSGIKGMRALAGKFTLRREEWLVLRDNLTWSEPIDDRLAAAFRYAPFGATSHLEGVRIVHFDTTPIEVTDSTSHERDAALCDRFDGAVDALRASQENAT